MNGNHLNHDLVAGFEERFVYSGVRYKKQQVVVQEAAGQVKEDYEVR